MVLFNLLSARRFAVEGKSVGGTLVKNGFHHINFSSMYLELFQLVLNVNCQSWIHGLILLDKVLESEQIHGQIHS